MKTMFFIIYSALIVAGAALATPCLEKSIDASNATTDSNETSVRNCSPVAVEVYFESLCPFSREFLTSQLFPAWDMLRDTGIMSVELYPFGNAREVQNAAAVDNSSWTFTCEHGDRECKVNAVEACLIAKAERDGRPYIPAVACLEDSEDPLESIESCITENSSFDANDIITCAQGPEGNAIQHEVAVKTHSLNPKHERVPWVVINGYHNATLQHEARTNLLKLVCRLYEGEKPTVCRLIESPIGFLLF